MGTTSSKPTFYHDYGAEGWVFNINESQYGFRLARPDIITKFYTIGPGSFTDDMARATGSSSSILIPAPTISQYPRNGKVSQGSDSNISFGGSGYTYTIDMGPYVGGGSFSTFSVISNPAGSNGGNGSHPNAGTPATNNPTSNTSTLILTDASL
jgi:hypothetical protein